VPTFTYEVKRENGETRRGTLQGESAEAVARELRAEGHFVVSVEAAARPSVGLLEVFSRHVLTPVFRPVSSKALAQFFSSLRALLSAGMTVSEALGKLCGRTRNRELARAAREMAEEAVRGRPMSTVMKRYPAAFNETTLAVVEAGEESGLLELTAERLASYFDRAFSLEQTYRWHTFYPKVLLVALVLIPSAPFLVLEGFAPWLQYVLAHSLPWLLAIAALWYGGRLLFRIPALRRAFDGLKLMAPWFGSLSRRLSTARWARALSMLLAAGVPVHRALLAAASATANSAMQGALVRDAAGVLHGKTLVEVVEASGQIPAMALDMLSSAQMAGSFEGTLDKVAEYYESETDVGGKQTAIAVGIVFYLIVAILIASLVIQFWSGYFGGYSELLE